MVQRSMKKTSQGKRKRRAFTAEYKAEVVALCEETGRSPESVGKDLGISASVIRGWVRSAKKDKGEGLSVSEKEELKALKKEIRQLRQERDLLRKATAFFVKEATS